MLAALAAAPAGYQGGGTADAAWAGLRAGDAVVVLRHAQTVPRDTLVVVTHQVNIAVLTGLVPAMGEVVVLKPVTGSGATGFTVAGRLTVP